MRDITHTVALRHRDLHTLEHATKHAEPHKCTQAYINTSTHLRAPFVVSVSLGHMHFCMQQWKQPQ